MKDPALPVPLIESGEYKWYACLVKPRSEKAVAERISGKGVECYLPLQQVRKRWSDRIKWIREPLIRSYVFVRVNNMSFSRILYTEGVLRFISFENRAVPIPDSQIDAMRLLLSKEAELEVTVSGFEAGRPVEVVTGPLIGLKGELVEIRGNKRVLIRLDQLGHGILVTIDPGMLAHI